MRSLWLGVFVCAVMLVACGDDDSDFATRPSDGSSLSSSSAKSNSSTKSSSSSEYTRVPCDVETDENCFKDDRDGQTYRTVKIGDQVWMAENLNFEMDSSFCYKNVDSNCAKYGRLYMWAAAMDSAGTWSTNGMGCGYYKTCSPTYPVCGVCPDGWHLPSKTEIETLFKAVGGVLDNDTKWRGEEWRGAGTALKSTSGWRDRGNGTDDFGFSVLSAGYRRIGGPYFDENEDALFWSSTEIDSGYAYCMYLHYNGDYAGLGNCNKASGFSVRCVKD